MPRYIAVNTVTSSGEVHRTFNKAMVATTSSANIMHPLAVLREMRSTRIVIMTKPLTFHASLSFSYDFPERTAFAPDVQAIAYGMIGGLRSVKVNKR